MTKSYYYNDGGRKDAGYKGNAGDCGVRAISIALKVPYKEAYRLCARANKAAGLPNSARNGIMKDIYSEILSSLGWSWKKAPKFHGRKAKCCDMPHNQTVIARQARHYVAVVDQIPHDTWDSSHKCVYGYWSKD